MAQVLRQELQPLSVQQQVLHSLAALLLRSPHGSAPSSPAASGGLAASPGDGGWAGAAPMEATSLQPLAAAPPVCEEQLAEGRSALLEELQGSLHDSLLIPERRLEELVEQVGGWGEWGIVCAAVVLRPSMPRGLTTVWRSHPRGCASLRTSSHNACEA